MTPPLKDCSNKIASSKRFQLVSSPDHERAAKGVVPAKTAAKTEVVHSGL